MFVFLANKNKHHQGSKSFNFVDYDFNFDNVLNICGKCKYFDDDTDFPNCFCNKSCEMIDYWFCSSKCPLGKFKLIDKSDLNSVNKDSV